MMDGCRVSYMRHQKKAARGRAKVDAKQIRLMHRLLFKVSYLYIYVVVVCSGSPRERHAARGSIDMRARKERKDH